MYGETCRWQQRLAVGGLWVLAWGVLFAPAQARASCGDGFMPLHVAGSAAQHTGTIPGLPRDDQTDRPQPGRAPCSGPFCSRTPLAPLAVPISFPLRWLDDPGVLAACFLVAQPSHFGLLVDVPISCPVRRSPDVFHPPR